ncbi:MAG: hypothetical protein ACRCZC_07695 [Culicoidibacterales bacterium]
MEYTSRVQRRKQLQQLESKSGVEELIDLEITKEMPITIQIDAEQSKEVTRQANRQQKQINELVEEIHPLTVESPIDDTNLEILKKVTIIGQPQTLADDVEYKQAVTKFSEATQQLSVLIGDLQKNKRKKVTLSKVGQTDEELPRNMFDLELAQTQEMPMLSQFHSKVNGEQVETQALQEELKVGIGQEHTQPIEEIQGAQNQKKLENLAESEEITKELTFNYKNIEELPKEEPEGPENSPELEKQIAKDRFINKLLIATLIFLSVAVIITLGIGLSIIFLNQNSL